MKSMYNENAMAIYIKYDCLLRAVLALNPVTIQ